MTIENSGKWMLSFSDGGIWEDIEEIEEINVEEIEADLTDWIQDGSWGDEKDIIDAGWSVKDEDGETLESGSLEVEVGDDPDPPDCSVFSSGHFWHSPEWLGGCRENPGVWDAGAGRVSRREVCRLCGTYRVTVSESLPGQYPREPERTSYEDADAESLRGRELTAAEIREALEIFANHYDPDMGNPGQSSPYEAENYCDEWAEEEDYPPAVAAACWEWLKKFRDVLSTGA